MFCTICCFSTQLYKEWLRHLIHFPDHVRRTFSTVNAWLPEDDERAIIVSNLVHNNAQAVSLEDILWHFSNFSIIGDMCYNNRHALVHSCVLLFESKCVTI